MKKNLVAWIGMIVLGGFFSLPPQSWTTRAGTGETVRAIQVCRSGYPGRSQ